MNDKEMLKILADMIREGRVHRICTKEEDGHQKLVLGATYGKTFSFEIEVTCLTAPTQEIWT